MEICHRSYTLVLSGFCIQHGEKHVAVSIPLCSIGSENFSQGRWRGMVEDLEGGDNHALDVGVRQVACVD